jgi:hypothetical protein
MAAPSFSDAQEDILSLDQANNIFQTRKGPSVIDKSLKDLILSHGLADKFGVILVHRHSRLNPGEAMVSYNNTSSPWPSQVRAPCGGSIIPQSWRMKDGKLQPYEYRFVPSRAGLNDALGSYHSFVTEFMKTLEHHDLSSCTGLSLVPESGKECLEITVNSANIMIPSDQVSKQRSLPSTFLTQPQLQSDLLDVDTTETMWFFDSNKESKKFRCTCVNTGSSTNSNHCHISR